MTISEFFATATVTKIRLKRFINAEMPRIVAVFIAVFILGLTAHAYGFLNLTIGHDSLAEFFASKGVMLWRIALGRFVVPVYQIIFHGRVTLPWLNGLLSLCWLSISVWLTAVIFSISKKTQLILLAGIYTTNITVTALAATYMHDLDADLFAVMLAVCAVFLWHRGRKIAWLGLPLLVLVLGLYQAMLSVAIVLIMLSSILALLQGDDAVKVVKKGLQAIVIILIAGVIYLFFVKLSCRVYGISLSNDYNGLTKLFESKGNLLQFVNLVRDLYKHWYDVLFIPKRFTYRTLFSHILLLFSAVIPVLYVIHSKVLTTSNKILAVMLVAILPLGMNISFLADGGMVHDLMIYAMWLTYLLVIILTDWYANCSISAKWLSVFCQTVTVIALSVALFLNIQIANAAYVKKDLERQTTLSMMTAVNAQMNKTTGYVAGKTEVVFVGTPQTGMEEMPHCLSPITGLNAVSPITCEEIYGPYYSYIMRTPLRQQSSTCVPIEFIKLMPAYPKSGYIQWYNGMLVVKLSGDENNSCAVGFVDKEISNMTPIKICDMPEIKLSCAEKVTNQYMDNIGIKCVGSLKRKSDSPMAVSDYILKNEYIGAKVNIKNARGYRWLVFYGRKVTDHGQPTVCVYDSEKKKIAEFSLSYPNIDTEWHQYIMDLGRLKGDISIIFNGGYVDNTGNKDSCYIFSNAALY